MKIIFVRHAPTKPNASQHSTMWELSEESQTLCYAVVEKIKHYGISKIYTSTESKAQLTGQFIAEKLDSVDIEIVKNIHETERHSKAFYDSQSDFRDAVKMAMLSPDKLLFGDETFTDARKRFATQVEALAEKHTDQTLIVVSHGRVLAMYLGHIMKKSPVAIWERLQMPAYAVLLWEQQKITEIQYEIEA